MAAMIVLPPMRLAAWLLLFLIAAAARSQAPTPAGLWKTFSDRTGQADGLVRIVESQGRYRATVEAVFSPPAESPNPLCELCPGELKNRPVVGLTIMQDLRPEADGWSGEILDPDDGKVYRCTVRLVEGGRKLEVRGYIGLPIFGRTQVWQRER
ncbi:MAG: DUF2147 domain-containing protein [Betaproteobacteria bacterium]|nr:DUF2147 domain-containing protein [Betaproteobacteria bacterium]